MIGNDFEHSYCVPCLPGWRDWARVADSPVTTPHCVTIKHGNEKPIGCGFCSAAYSQRTLATHAVCNELIHRLWTCRWEVRNTHWLDDLNKETVSAYTRMHTHTHTGGFSVGGGGRSQQMSAALFWDEKVGEPQSSFKLFKCHFLFWERKWESMIKKLPGA